VSEAPGKILVDCEVNGLKVSIHAHPMARLLDVLREDLHLTGTKEGCGEGECGACSVEMDGALVNSCLVPALNLLARNSAPTETEIREGLGGNLCRCTGYMKIFEAVMCAAKEIEARG